MLTAALLIAVAAFAVAAACFVRLVLVLADLTEVTGEIRRVLADVMLAADCLKARR